MKLPGRHTLPSANRGSRRREEINRLRRDNHAGYRLFEGPPRSDGVAKEETKFPSLGGVAAARLTGWWFGEGAKR